MAHGLFGGSLPTQENPIVPTRKNSRANSVTYLRRQSRLISISPLHIHEQFMNEALHEARASLTEGGIPIGCVLIRNGQIIARGHNRRVQCNSAILHAELDCLETAGRQSTGFYNDCTLYTTITPCAISASAIRFYGIPRVVIGDNKIFHRDENLLRTGSIQIDIIDSQECHDLLANYIKENSSVWNENIAHDIH